MSEEIEYLYPHNLFELRRLMDMGYTKIETKHQSEDGFSSNNIETIYSYYRHPAVFINTELPKGCIRVSRPESDTVMI